MQRYLPFWLANFVQRLILVLVLVPLIAVLVPAFKLLPSLLEWRQQNKLFRHYGELKFLEGDMASRALSADETKAALAQLGRIEREVIANKFALDFADRTFTLRQHVDCVREKLGAAPNAWRNRQPRRWQIRLRVGSLKAGAFKVGS